MSENLGELQAEVERLRDENDKLRASNQRCMRIARLDFAKYRGLDQVVEEDRPIS